MAAGVPRGKDAAGGTCGSERDSGALKSQGQGGKEDPERGAGSGAGGPQVSAAGRPRRAPARPRYRGYRGPSPSHLPQPCIPAPAAVLTSSLAFPPPSPQSPCPHPTLSASLSSCPTFQSTSPTPTPNFIPSSTPSRPAFSPCPCLPASHPLSRPLRTPSSCLLHPSPCSSSRLILRPCCLPGAPFVLTPASHPFCSQPLPSPPAAAATITTAMLCFAMLPSTLTLVESTPCPLASVSRPLPPPSASLPMPRPWH